MPRLRIASIPALAIAALLASFVAPITAQADDSSTLTVVGTSDVSDSNLVADVLKPGFEAYEAHLPTPQTVSLNYVPLGTGAAIKYAEKGTASALIVHAPSQENQFVAQGYSNNDEPGRAVFYGDYVLVGPPSDPAGVLNNATTNIAQAFEDIAAAGANGKAVFVSRDSSYPPPGTGTEEDAIWALTSGVTTCTVSSANGNGARPSTATGACPADPTAQRPNWYQFGNYTSQAMNIEAAAACNYTGANDDCYTLTDRGTFDYLESQSPNPVSNLEVLNKAQGVDAPGGATLLTNTFHAYAVNPGKFSGSTASGINSTLAEAFLNWLTLPSTQTTINNYLPEPGQTPVFAKDAAPALTATPSSTSVTGGHQFTVSGKLTNVVPGTPPLSAQQVTLSAVPKSNTKATPVVVGQTYTNPDGSYSIDYTPSSTATYTVSTGEIRQLEYAYPNGAPPFEDLLAPAAASFSVGVTSHIRIESISAKRGTVTFTGTLAPAAGSGAHISLYAAHTSNAAHGLHFRGARTVRAGTTHFRVAFPLTRGHEWTVQLNSVDSGVYAHARTSAHRVRVS